MTGIASSLLCCCDAGQQTPLNCLTQWRDCPDDIYLDISTSTYTYAHRVCIVDQPGVNHMTDGPCSPQNPFHLPGYNCGCISSICRHSYTEYRRIATYSIQMTGLRLKKRLNFSAGTLQTVIYTPAGGDEQTGSILAEYLVLDRQAKDEGSVQFRPCTYYDETKSFTHGAPLRTEGPYNASLNGFIRTVGYGYEGQPFGCQARIELNIVLKHPQGMEVHRESSADTSDPCHSRNWNGGPFTEYRPAEMSLWYEKYSQARPQGAPPICPLEWLEQPAELERIWIPHDLPTCLAGPFGCTPTPSTWEIPGTVENIPWEPPCSGNTFQSTYSMEIGTPTIRYGN